MHIFFPSFLIALLVTVFCTPVARKVAFKIGAVDHPNDRKIHSTDIPRIGGVAIYAGFIAAVVFGLALGYFTGVHLNPRPIIGILIGGTIVFLSGLKDDLRGSRPLTKLAWQTLAAIVAIYFGIEISFFSNPFNGIIPLFGFIAIPLTILWLVGMTNAINLIDGLDGLATGVIAISAGTLFFVALRTHQIEAALFIIAIAGAALGFLRYNFFPASIFLGDSGSYLLGFIVAAASIIGVFKTTLVVALIVPLLILGVPIFDTTFAILRRIKEKKNPFAADNRHIHHVLIRAGLTQREAVMSIYIVCFLLSATALIMSLQK
ncbi:hypothetical protein A3K48_00280 [candidate division WOR-1 bacterium RIFOXYA12_FULL_52_29]|uniref:Undecaprenyl-phosphate alpha-N-acetylglucosaminyl 1-phosphate transferase n=1 Tax=candidate division WOR-1 bacterium RIFOXYC12_FULL_54_18 TaxID=1802584 RepID=A0A1F4T4P4_UNCSA|nr:MAG: hypothetical protein A3K44_00280 [candidate division WOR-1 bacterium RIFOXYA2_FULL_51_19]OGC17042.1 MAG: hypothetical protein A3K48_00280 [candidate division WOR-1 bacterium RIFOXYA12_FULL_52_29]OGC25903.1 MAG: hypothetical protein A3K32_00280 [candidate division WOR-1 bacterium RIFOXYB2_FULL_45_9]OGC27459.1 MAG: hypothetical protein A3K49_00280 [candidate division WOR-1 bacterium RIFOXYC12_FULL_54_18]OGC29328.1 MAG: hypothetical protein A2346_01425 [candidate division WOR-1 bacterium R